MYLQYYSGEAKATWKRFGFFSLGELTLFQAAWRASQSLVHPFFRSVAFLPCMHAACPLPTLSASHSLPAAHTDLDRRLAFFGLACWVLGLRGVTSRDVM